MWATILYALFFFILYFRLERLRRSSAEWIERRRTPLFELKRAGALSRKDVLPISAVTLVYAAATFLNLGNTVSPQSFLRFDNNDHAAVSIELHNPSQIEQIFYFTGLHRGRDRRAYKLEFSPDGVNWTEQYRDTTNATTGEVTRISGMTQDHSETFRWLTANLLPDQPDDTRFIRISPLYVPLELGEVSITVRGKPLLVSDLIIPGRAAALFDEQDVVPERYDILNSSHFDEIYHAHTAYQHLIGEYPYETTHPPLGKLITSAGIWIFGMTPFGWRFMPALFGVLMLPPLYILLKWMFNKTSVAVCGTLLFAFDFMHFVQTRISTIDVYCVFFVLLMAVFMYRYITSGLDAPFWKTAAPLIFAGLSFGIGAAAKWQSIYAGAGLLALFLIYLFRRYKHSLKHEKPFGLFFTGTVLVALFSFILIPGVLYIACYIPYVLPSAPESGFIGAVWEACYENQKSMFKYHADLVAEHHYSANWYQWLVNSKPILYYINSVGAEGTRGSLWALTNPLTTWAGLGALAVCAIGAVKRRSHTALFILIGYLSQLLPWVLVSRLTFPYHYFPSMLFICIALSYVFHRMIERDRKRGTRHMVAFTAVAMGLFALFYPVLTGMQVPAWYPQYLLRWLPNWMM
jgi:4-amino-4-deoxy-L-arabinose transferase-like glycosyltransferase